MKIVGGILITIGLALMLIVIYNFLSQRNKVISPVPEDQGVKVIFITPSK